MSKQIDFQVNSGKPLCINVIKDGKDYIIRVGVVIFGVEDSNEVDKNGIPKFQIQANSVIDVSKSS